MFKPIIDLVDNQRLSSVK